jgi:alpha-tubulin suppressor-like RCC1 family protein
LPNAKGENVKKFTKANLGKAKAVMVGAGPAHTVVSTSDGIYVAGANSNGQLGFPEGQPVTQPGDFSPDAT